MEFEAVIFNQCYTCVDFQNFELKFYGVDISLNGEYLGKMIGVKTPDPNDTDEVDTFLKELEEWVLENL